MRNLVFAEAGYECSCENRMSSDEPVLVLVRPRDAKIVAHMSLGVLVGWCSQLEHGMKLFDLLVPLQSCRSHLVYWSLLA
jgi:hypothetical protein